MKLTATLGLILVCWHACAMETHGYTIEVNPAKAWQDFLEIHFKTICKEGDQTRGIPILDPFDEEELPITIDYKQIQLKGNLKNTLVNGFSNYDVSDTKIELLRLKFTAKLIWSEVTARLAYEIVEGTVDGLKCSGSGNIALTAKNFAIAADVTLRLVNGKNLEVSNVVTKHLDMEEMDFKIDGLIIDNEDKSDYLNNLVPLLPKLIKKNQEQYMKEFNYVFAKILKRLLVDKIVTLTKLLAFIQLI